LIYKDLLFLAIVCQHLCSRREIQTKW